MEQATQRMLAAAGIRPGHRVLDIAAGAGDQSLAAARIVGSGGYVLATDVSAPMLKAAEKAAQQAGLSNVGTKVMDAQHIDLEPESFDAAISRNGLMYIPDLLQALTGVRRVLHQGGKFAALVWSKAENNPAFAQPLAILFRYAGVPEPSFGGRGLFDLGDRDLAAGLFCDAGFSDVTTETIPLVIRAPSAEAYFLQRKRTSMMAELFNKLSEDDREKAEREIMEALRPFEKKRSIRSARRIPARRGEQIVRSNSMLLRLNGCIDKRLSSAPHEICAVFLLGLTFLQNNDTFIHEYMFIC